MVVVAVEMPAERRAEVVAASFCLAGVVSAAARVPSVRAVFEVSVRRNASITRMKKLMRKPEVSTARLEAAPAPSNSFECIEAEFSPKNGFFRFWANY